MAGPVMPPAAASTMAGVGLTVGAGQQQQLSASFVNSFRVAAVADRLALHLQPGYENNATEFFGLCLSLARGIDYAVANNEVPAKAQSLPLLLKQVCQRRNDLFLQAAIMVLMISVKNACKIGWFPEKETRELFALATEIGNGFRSPGDINIGSGNSLSMISAVMSRFYPLMKMGQIIASLEVKPGYGAHVIDFHISKNTMHSPQEKIHLFVAQTDNIDTSVCIISPQQVNFLLNGKAVERRTNVLMDPGPQMPTNVTAMLKYGTNLLQAVGQFNGHYIITIAFMSVAPLPDAPVLLDYVQSIVAEPDPDSEIIEGPSRISLNCPISYTRIRTPVKGHSCKHLQCFDFRNFVDINSRRPSWRCPHCNQHVCYPDIRVDQNMVKVLKEVGEEVNDVIISADGSWKAVLESDDNVDQTTQSTLNCPKEGPEQPESTPASIALPIVLDLTMDDDKMDIASTGDTEDRKPLQATLQIQPVAIDSSVPSQLNNANAVNQNVATQMEDDFWSGVYFTNGSVTSSTRSGAQMVNGISEPTSANTMTTDAISPAPNSDVGGHGNGNMSSVMQDQFSPGNLQLQQSQILNSIPNNEYGRLAQIPRHISRTPIAVQALPVPSQMPTPQQRSRTNLNTVTSNGSLSQPALSMGPTASGFHMNPQVSGVTPSLSHRHSTVQIQNRHDRPFIPVQSVQQQVGPSSSTQLPGAYRGSSGMPEFQNLHLQQALRMPQSRSQSPSIIRSSSPLPQSQTWQGVAPPNSIHPRYTVAAQRAHQVARQPPSVPVQIQSSRAGTSYPANANGIRALATEQRANAGGVAQVVSGSDLPSEQNWRPTGRMRGSLAGRAYSTALKDLMIQPTQPAQVPRPQSNLTSTQSSVQNHLQALLTNSRNARVPQTQNNPMTQPGSTSGSSGNLP